MARADINRFMFRKLKAIRQIRKYLFLNFVSDEPVNTNLVYALFVRIHQDLPLFQIIACKELLDYYYPKWRDFADKSVLGIITVRNDKEVMAWRKGVVKSFGYRCNRCGSEDNLQAHHILPWAEYPEARTDIDNGVCLCGDCHSFEHPKMGIGMFNKTRVNLQ